MPAAEVDRRTAFCSEPEGTPPRFFLVRYLLAFPATTQEPTMACVENFGWRWEWGAERELESKRG